MRTFFICFVLVAAACTSPRAKVPEAERAPLEGATIRIAAAGDISNNELSGQQLTSDLVLDGGYDAVLLMGDNQYPRGALADYRKFYDPTWGRFKAITYPSPGNHEYGTKNAAGYFEYFGERAGPKGKGYYSFDLGDWHFISLNSNCNEVGCDGDSEQVTWLIADLKKNDKKCTLAYWHHPRFNSGMGHGNSPSVRAFWEALAAGKADVILVGHEHIYERFTPMNAQGEPDKNGIRQFTVGTGGGSLYGVAFTMKTSEEHQSSTFGILALTLAKDSYDWKFIPTPGSTYTDSGRGACH